MLQHRALSNSPALELFMVEGEEQFRESFDKLEKVAMQQEGWGGVISENYTTIKGMVKKGFSLVSGWFGGESTQNKVDKLANDRLQ